MREKGGRMSIFCVCFKSFEGGRVDGGDGECFFFILHKMKRFVGIQVGLFYFTKYLCACILLQYTKLNII